MRAFGAADVGRFGRAHEVDDLDRGERAIYVIGPSWSGNSSLVQAGLLLVIDAGSSRFGRTFAARTMRSGGRPTERLAHAIDGDLGLAQALGHSWPAIRRRSGRSCSSNAPHRDANNQKGKFCCHGSRAS
jgi:hypothetical protein